MENFWEKTKETDKKLNKKKMAIVISIIVIAVIILITFSLYIFNPNIREWMNINILGKQITHEGVVKIDKMDIPNGNIYAFDKYIAILDKSELKLYGANGNVKATLDVMISNPIYDSTNRFLAIAENGGRKIYIVEDDKIAWKADVEGDIIQIAINENGYVVVTTEDSSYKTVVIMFDSEGNQLFKKFLSTTIVVDVDISKDNKYLALAQVETSGTIIESSVNIIDIEASSTTTVEIEDIIHQGNSESLIVSIEYQNKGTLLCMYTDSVRMIENTEDKLIVDTKERNITYQSVKINNSIVSIEEKASGIFSANSYIEILDIDNNKIKNYEIDTIIKEMVTKGEMIALNLGTELEIINTDGWLVKRYISAQEINAISLSEKIAAVIYSDSIDIIDF